MGQRLGHFLDMEDFLKVRILLCPPLFTMLSIRQDLKTREAADAFNKRIYDWRCEAAQTGAHPGCIGELACVHCYHVISDSICLCIGTFTCPKCGEQNGTPIRYESAGSPVRGQLVWVPSDYPSVDYAI